MNDNRSLIEALTKSELYQNFERAFGDSTGLPVALRPVESWQLPHHRSRNENPFCALMARKSKACAACLRVQQELAETSVEHTNTVVCPVGLCDTADPVRTGDRLVGFLHTGQVFRKTPTEAQFERTKKLAAEWGVDASPEELRRAYFDSSILKPRQHDAAVQLLTIFAGHLSLIGNQIVVQRQNSLPPVIIKAIDYIKEHQSEDLSLSQVARAVNTSTFYFCKIFRKATGINFTDYLSRLRVERAKNLLLNPNHRISEVAYEVGFQSLTHFNRVFRKILGQSPTEYRQHLARA